MKPISLSFPAILSLAFFGTLAQGQTTYTFKQVAKFDYPGATVTLAAGIDSSNNVVGAYIPEGAQYANGFERSADGTFSAPIIAPGGDVVQTLATAINDTGTIAGAYTTNLGYTHGFFLKDGVYTVFDYPGAYLTMIQGINDAGDFVGWYILLDQTGGAFASIGGNLIPIAIPNSTYVSPSDINNKGEIAGWYNRPNNSISFLRESDGTLRYPIHPRGSSATLFGTNDQRYSVGQTYDGTALHGLFFSAPSTFFTYDFPNSSYVQLNGINDAGFICGHGYNNLTGVTHSYIVRVQAGSAQ